MPRIPARCRHLSSCVVIRGRTSSVPLRGPLDAPIRRSEQRMNIAWARGFVNPARGQGVSLRAGRRRSRSSLRPGSARLRRPAAPPIPRPRQATPAPPAVPSRRWLIPALPVERAEACDRCRAGLKRSATCRMRGSGTHACSGLRFASNPPHARVTPAGSSSGYRREFSGPPRRRRSLGRRRRSRATRR